MSNFDYKNKVILAPMVRAGTLPLRLLALDYGADIVYCEELIDWKLIRSIRKVNEALGTIDYIDKTDGTVVFRTCNQEKGRVVLQIGTCSAERALIVAKKVEEDVAAIDINMGCPKEFSIKGGMGAALLSKPDLACNIISTLALNISIPVSCKIRLLSTTEETINFCKRLETSGVSAIAIHGRTKEERPQHPNRNEEIAFIASHLSVPVIANGGSREIHQYSDIERFRLACGASSVMLARAAQRDCTIFKCIPQNSVPQLPVAGISECLADEGNKVSVDTDVRWKSLEPLIKDYLHYAVRYASPAPNVKYCIQAMLKDLQDTALGKKFLETQTLLQICEIWGMGKFCRTTEEQQKLQKELVESKPVYIPQIHNLSKDGESESENYGAKKLKTDVEGEKQKSDIVELHVAFLRSLYKEDKDLPKTQLLLISRKKRLQQPKYKTQQVDKLFRSEVLFDGCKYTSTYWEKNKRAAEQGAALACLVSIGAVQPSDDILTHCTRF